MIIRALILMLMLFVSGELIAQDNAPLKNTFPPIQDSSLIPENVTDLWKDYDPTKEPLDVEVIKTSEDDGVVCEYVLFTVATFRGRPSRLAAYYTYPKGGKSLPAFVWAHGGGQRADKTRGLHFAKNGYATLDINWNGRELEPDVEQNTDWGNIDPTQGKPYYAKAPRAKRNVTLTPDEYSVDPVVSPRNKYWFMLAVAGRRAITFLEQQEQVDPNRIGFTGFSMGGNITAFCAMDPRLKAVAPIVGGAGFTYESLPGYPERTHFPKNWELERQTIVSEVYWPHVKVPVLFISSSNDFHGRVDFLQRCADLLPEKTRWNLSLTLHNNHSPGPRQLLALLNWFDLHLKGGDAPFPLTPTTTLAKESDNVWKLTVSPDQLDNVKEVRVYYSWDGAIANRFHKPVDVKRVGDDWEAMIPAQQGLPLTAFANVLYPTKSGATEQALFGKSDTYALASRFHREVPAEVSPKTFQETLPLGKFEPTFAEFPKDNLIWAERHQDMSLLTYKFNDRSLDFPNEKKLRFHIKPHGRNLNLAVSFASQSHIIRQRDEIEGHCSVNKVVQGEEAVTLDVALADITKKNSKGEVQSLSAWRNIATMRVQLIDRETRKQLNLLGDESGKYLSRIEWVD